MADWPLVADRAGRTRAQGRDPPPADRPASPGGRERRRALGAAGAVPVPVPLGLQLPGRPRRADRRGLRPLRPGTPAAGRLLHPFRQHPRLRRRAGRASRPAPPRHPVARPLSRRLPRPRGEPAEPGAGRTSCSSRRDSEPVGFAAPHGRWNAGLDAVLDELGYLYSSDFQLGYDDLPFFPWREDRFSSVLQVPIHPICEGLFLDAGVRSGRGDRRPPRRRSSVPRSMPASRRSSTAIPSAGWRGSPRSSRPSTRRRRATRCSGGSR